MISFFKDELESYRRDAERGETLSYPPVYPICLILSKLRPFVFKSNDPSFALPQASANPDPGSEDFSSLTRKTRRSSPLSLSALDYKFFFEYLVDSLKNKNYLVRNLVSKSLICVLPQLGISQLVGSLLSPVLSGFLSPGEITLKHNEVHGRLSASFYVLRHYFQDLRLKESKGTLRATDSDHIGSGILSVFIYR